MEGATQGLHLSLNAGEKEKCLWVFLVCGGERRGVESSWPLEGRLLMLSVFHQVMVFT